MNNTTLQEDASELRLVRASQEAYITDKSVTRGFHCETLVKATPRCQKRFTGMNVSDLLFLEIFAGTARLIKSGSRCWYPNFTQWTRRSARASQIFIAQYDLAGPNDVEALVELIRTAKTSHLWRYTWPQLVEQLQEQEKRS